MRTLYYDCFSGISGDMNLGAMIDLGVEEEFLKTELTKLSLEGWELSVEKDQRHGIYGTKVTVLQTRDEHVHRHLSDIKAILDKSSLDRNVIELSYNIFIKVAEAEAKVHNTSIEKIHFHEVGAIDSIIDVVGAAICFIKLGIDEVIAGEIELGGGFVQCAHGNLPVPAPATAEIIKGLAVSSGGVNFEATTPTGAAILKTLVSSTANLNEYIIRKTGYGIGQKVNPDKPNILRTYILEGKSIKKADPGSLMLECNIDDMNPEWYEYLITALMDAGASDAFLTNIIMKRGRPGVKLSVLIRHEDKDRIVSLIFKHTTTLGIRETGMIKHSLERQVIKVATRFGDISVKLAFKDGKIITAKPEYKECRLIAEKENLSLKEVNRIVLGSVKNLNEYEK